MARIKKLKENGNTIYPATIPAAVVDPVTGKKIGELYLSLTGGTLAGDLQFSSYGNSGERGIKAVMASNDYWGIVGRSTEDNKGILEIYTGDDGGNSTYNEIVKFSQYSGTRTTESMPVREFVVFDKSGNTSIPGTLSIGSTLTLRGNKGNANVFTDFNGGRGAVLRITDSSGVLHELGMWNNGQPVYIKDNGKYYLYHAGNLGVSTSSKAGLVKSGGNIDVDSLGNVAVKGCSFANNSDAIDIDRYTQGELGSIHIWLNGNQADGNVPDYPENGVVIQSHFRFENDEGEYKYRYTQMFVGKNGTLYSRTSAEGSTLGFTPSSWEEWNRSGCYYFYLGEMTVGSPGSSSTSVTFSSGSSVFPVMKALLNSYFPGNAGNHIPDIQISFGLDTSAGTQNIRAKLLSHFRNTNGIDGLFFLYQNALHGGSNYLNILRITIDTSGTAACTTIDMKI